jgi:hypothetical protein
MGPLLRHAERIDYFLEWDVPGERVLQELLQRA